MNAPFPADPSVDFPELTSDTAFAFYESVRHRLPIADFSTAKAVQLPDLAPITDDFDVFVFDAYGVLNRGVEGILGAAERMQALWSAGKECFVLTNGASQTLADNLGKFERLNMPFDSAHIMSSRMATDRALSHFNDEYHWGVVAARELNADELPVRFTRLRHDPSAYRDAQAILLMSVIGYDQRQLDLLRSVLSERNLPFLIANPDVVAPQGGHFSLEPGFFGHRLADEFGFEPDFYGKPYSSVFDLVSERVGSIAPDRIVMMGDTLHTDILGAAALGWKTVLVTDHGLFAGHDAMKFVNKSGIVPDYLVPHI